MINSLFKALSIAVVLWLPCQGRAATERPFIVYEDASQMAPANETEFSRVEGTSAFTITITKWPENGSFNLYIGHGGSKGYGMAPDVDKDKLKFDEPYNAKKIDNNQYWTITASHDVYENITIHVTGESNVEIGERKIWLTGKYKTPVPMPYIAEKLITTYSNSSAMDLPDGLRAYEAYQYDSSNSGTESDKHGTLFLRRLQYVPANTGVLLVGEVKQYVDDEGNKVDPAPSVAPYELYYLTPHEGASATTDEELATVWTRYDEYKANDAWHNFFIPEVTGNRSVGNSTINDDVIYYRHFGLSPYHLTVNGKEEGVTIDDERNYWGFFRFTRQGRVGAHKAWLRLPTPSQALIDCSNDQSLADKYGYLDYDGQLLAENLDDGSDMNTPRAKMALVFDDVQFVSTPSGISETVAPDVEPSADDGWFSLQGFRISHPAQAGVYIHNGKKIVLK